MGPGVENIPGRLTTSQKSPGRTFDFPIQLIKQRPPLTLFGFLGTPGAVGVLDEDHPDIVLADFVHYAFP